MGKDFVILSGQTAHKVVLCISVYDGKPADLEKEHVIQTGVIGREWEGQPIADQVKITYYFMSETDKQAFIGNLSEKAKKDWLRA